ncbi:MAG: PilZ domain-containing protein [Thermodesulfobacteriota bacterium]
MAEANKIRRDVAVSPLTAELIDTVVNLSPDQQRELLSELSSRKGEARRRFSRRPHREAVQFSAGGKLFSGAVKNVSDNGLFVETLMSDLRRLEPGEKVTVSFEHPNSSESRYVKRSGEIARTSREGIGIRLYSLL